MDVHAWYILFFCTNVILPAVILLSDDGNFKRKNK